MNLAVRAYHYLKEELEADGLVISTGKTGFVVSNSEAKKLLKDVLPANGPTVHDVMRDLGCDCTSGRLRRIMTMKATRNKGGRKGKKLFTLKIAMKAVRLRLFKGSILAGIKWGHEAMGAAPASSLQSYHGSSLGAAKDWQSRHCF